MTRFSIIVTVHDLAPYIGQCLASITSQSVDDFEVIALDDNSSDGSGEIVAEAARSDGRIVPVHLEQTHGPGAAHNVATGQATGDYLLFVDGDDALADETALAGIAAHIDAHDEPDIVIFDFAYHDFVHDRPCERHRGTDRFTCVRDVRGTFRLRDVPEASNTSWVPWNKAYRRPFVEAHGLSFPAGYYFDSVWSVTALVTASSIAALPQKCVRYRCCRSDSMSRAPDAGHFEIFDQYDRINAFLDQHAELAPDEVRSAIHGCMAGFLGELGTRGVVPLGLLPELTSKADRYIARLDQSDGGG